MTRNEALKYRQNIESAASTMNDESALQAVDLFPSYEKLVSTNTTVERGFRFRYDEKLYRTEQPVYTFDGTYAPGPGTESLYSEVTLEEEGTHDNPIHYNGNMELYESKYYTQNDILYLCTRSTGVPVFNPLADLVGIYVEVAK